MYGDKRELEDGWTRSRSCEVEEICFVVNSGMVKPRDGLYNDDVLIKDRNGKCGFGGEKASQGLYRILPFRELEVFEFTRGNQAESVCEYIDHLDP